MPTKLKLCQFFLQRALPPTLGALLFFLLPSEPAHAFGKKPVVVPPQPPPSTPTVPSAPTQDVIRARWEPDTRDGATWSQHVYDALPKLGPNLLGQTPSDIARFCPAYSQLSASDQKNFWVYLVSSIAQLESDFDPNASYTENFRDSQGNLVVSLGLLQLSVGDGAIYGCGFRGHADVVDPLKNLDCGLRILNKWVGRDHAISGQSSGGWIGGARYWSTLRSSKLSQIEGWTRALPMCGN